MKTISMLELRNNSESVVNQLRKGLSLLLTYRGKPLARLEPIRPEKMRRDEDPLFLLAQTAVPSPLGPLEHEDIDKIVYA